MAWILLVVAGLLEIGFAVAMKKSGGFQHVVPTVLFLVFAAASMALLAVATKTLPVGTAYAAWTGIGAAGTAIVGMLLLSEPADALRILAIGLIVLGVVVLQLVETS